MVSLLRRTQYGAYNTAKQTTSKTRQVVMLYDGVIRFVQQARQAIEEKRFEDRYNLLNKASEVVVGLQGALDFESGDEISRQLYDFYATIDTHLVTIQRTNSLEGCDQVIELLKVMRSEWSRIDTLQEQQGNASPVPLTSTASEGTEEADGDSAAESVKNTSRQMQPASSPVSGSVHISA